MSTISLAPSPLPSLADELFAALPSLICIYPDGVTVKVAKKHLGTDAPSVRAAMRDLNAGRATLMRRIDSREIYLVPNRYRSAPGLVLCARCGKPFKRVKKSLSRTCSRSCAVSISWQSGPTRERRGAGICRAFSTPKAKARLAEHNRKRWSKAGEREKLSRRSKEMWADPATKENLTRSIKLINGSPEARQRVSQMRRKQWKDPVFRKKTIEGIQRSKRTPEARAKFSKLLKARWRDPVSREKYLAATRKNSAKAVAAITGKKQSPEQVAKRVASTNRSRDVCGALNDNDAAGVA